MDPEDGDNLETPEDGGAADDGASGSDNSAPPAAASGTGNDQERINGLMSNWQREQARANQLQAQLDALQGKPAAPVEPAGGDANLAAQRDEFIEFAREGARRQVFESDPRLAAAGLDASSISGSTLDEMKASLARQVKLIESISSAERSRLLVEHGLDPEVGAGAREQVPSFETMSEEDFKKFLDKRDGKTW